MVVYHRKPGLARRDQNQTKQGSVFWVRDHIAPLYDINHQKIGYTAIYQDITNEKLIKEQVGGLQSRVNSIANNSLAAIYIYDFTLAKSTYINPEYTHLLGYTQDDLDAIEDYTTLLHPDDVTPFFNQMNKIINPGKEGISELHLRFKHKEGQWVWCHSKCTLLDADQTGKPRRMMGMFVDVTRLIELEQSKREHDKILIQQSKLAAMGEMIQNIAHQWRQPLTLLSMHIIDLEKKFKKGKFDKNRLDNFMEKSQEIIENMDSTIESFSAYYRPNKEKRPFDLTASIENSIKFLSALIKKQKIDIQFKSDMTGTIIGYENEFSQVILNLLKNSIDAIIEKKVKQGIIEIELIELSNQWTLFFKDNGGGVPENIIDRIFEPYFTTKYKSNGTGVGLYMSKMIIEESFGGSIKAGNSALGALFIITLSKGGRHVTE